MKRTTPYKLPDEDVELLAGLSQNLRKEYARDREVPWEGSPFAWILNRPSRQRWKIGEQLIAGWCAMKGLNVMRSPDSDADRVIEGHRVEVKFSTLWKNGIYRFQQIRDQEYEFLICLGVSSFDAHAWMFRKDEIPFKEIEHQHGGSAGRDTWWITVEPNSPPAWMRKQTGRLGGVCKMLAKLK